LALESLGLYTETVTAYQASLQPNASITAYVYERLGDLAASQSQFSDAIKWYTAGLEATTDRSFQVHLREGVAAAYLAQENLEAALAQYEAILAISYIPAYRAKIIRLKGEAYLEAGDLALAQAQFQEALDLYPDAFDSYLGLIEMVNHNMVVDDFQRGYTDYYGGSAYQPAINAMERYLATSPHNRGDEALWVIGFSARALGQYEKAIATFERLITEYPASDFWLEAHLQRARTMGWQGNTIAAIQHYRDFASQYPDSDLSPDALWRASLLELQAGQLDAAHKNFHGVAQKYPFSDFADDALYWSGMAAYRNENFADAETTWASLLLDYPTGEFAPDASFWQAKALLLLDREDEARKLLTQLGQQPFSYYSLRARDILAAEDPHAAPAASTPLTFTAATEEAQAEAEAWLANWLGLNETARLSSLDRLIMGDPAFIRAETLSAFGLIDEALDEYETVQQSWFDNPLAMYQLALAFKKRGAYRLSILSALRLVELSPAIDPASVPHFIRRLIYPIYYRDLILTQAEANNLDPALVFALIRQESLYEASAQSIADARGLMQVIPPTGADIAGRTNTADYTPDSLWLPYRSVEFGTWYLRQMLDFFDQDQFAALAAYNAGPGNVQSWQPFPEDLDIFVAQIPLSEPRSYIRRIYLNLGHYRDIYK